MNDLPKGWIVIGKKKGHNSYTTGVVERSFSIDVANGRASIYWYGPAVSNFGTRHMLHAEDVKHTAEKHRDMFNKSYPDQQFEVWDLDDPQLPIIIDWDEWREAGQPAETLSGVKDKYKRRNPRFEMKP